MKKIVLALCAMGAATLATPAMATTEVVGSAVGCATAPLAPPADKCAGYYDKNQFSLDNVGAQQDAVDLLVSGYTVNWNALVAAGKVVSGGDVNALNALLANAGGQVLLGMHWGNVPDSPDNYGNVSAFYLWNNVTPGSIHLTDTGGYSNAVLYISSARPPVPEPATWAMMLLGFGAIGMVSRRSRKPVLAQIA